MSHSRAQAAQEKAAKVLLKIKDMMPEVKDKRLDPGKIISQGLSDAYTLKTGMEAEPEKPQELSLLKRGLGKMSRTPQSASGSAAEEEGGEKLSSEAGHQRSLQGALVQPVRDRRNSMLTNVFTCQLPAVSSVMLQMNKPRGDEGTSYQKPREMNWAGTMHGVVLPEKAIDELLKDTPDEAHLLDPVAVLDELFGGKDHQEPPAATQQQQQQQQPRPASSGQVLRHSHTTSLTHSLDGAAAASQGSKSRRGSVLQDSAGGAQLLGAEAGIQAGGKHHAPHKRSSLTVLGAETGAKAGDKHHALDRRSSLTLLGAEAGAQPGEKHHAPYKRSSLTMLDSPNSPSSAGPALRPTSVLNKQSRTCPGLSFDAPVSPLQLRQRSITASGFADLGFGDEDDEEDDGPVTGADAALKLLRSVDDSRCRSCEPSFTSTRFRGGETWSGMARLGSAQALDPLLTSRSRSSVTGGDILTAADIDHLLGQHPAPAEAPPLQLISCKSISDHSKHNHKPLRSRASQTSLLPAITSPASPESRSATPGASSNVHGSSRGASVRFTGRRSVDMPSDADDLELGLERGDSDASGGAKQGFRRRRASRLSTCSISTAADSGFVTTRPSHADTDGGNEPLTWLFDQPNSPDLRSPSSAAQNTRPHSSMAALSAYGSVPGRSPSPFNAALPPLNHPASPSYEPNSPLSRLSTAQLNSPAPMGSRGKRSSVTSVASAGAQQEDEGLFTCLDISEFDFELEALNLPSPHPLAAPSSATKPFPGKLDSLTQSPKRASSCLPESTSSCLIPSPPRHAPPKHSVSNAALSQRLNKYNRPRTLAPTPDALFTSQNNTAGPPASGPAQRL